MAKIYPQCFPQWAIEQGNRSAERKVFEKLAQLPEPYVVFYSAAWQVRTSREGAQDGEADFIVAHPEKGIMILEVKGGRIRYDASLQQWYSRDRNGMEHAIKDPIQQARNSKGALLHKLRELPGWRDDYLTIAYMVVFPDVLAGQASLRPDLPRDLLIDVSDLESLEAHIENGFAWFAGEERRSGALGVQRLRLLESLLANSFTLKTPMGVELAQDEARIIELTEQQMHLLDFIQRQRRAVIEGCAGSGKTTLALEKARRLSEQGFETLLVCFNAPLAEYLRQCAPQGVDVYHFHGLCTDLAKKAALGYRAYRTEAEFYDTVLPQMLLEAIEELGTQYDAIIVDEGQDFRPEWFETLLFLLHDDKQGIFYVFSDSNQNLYRRAEHLSALLGVEPFTLYENCRNTRAIHEVVRAFHHQPELLTCRGPEGRAPEIVYFASEREEEEHVRRILHRLVTEEKVEAAQIVLLTTRAPEKTPFVPGRKLGNFVLSEWGDRNWRKSDIRVSSVHRFKGLESRAVVLAGLEDNDPSWLDPLLYVACSRARAHLVIVAHERSRNRIQTILDRGHL
jgi:hypothetical protein